MSTQLGTGEVLKVTMRNAGWLAGCLAVLSCGAAQAAERVALVVGNANYHHAPPLANPRNDAEDIAALLRGLGFQVTAGVDLDDAAMRDRVRSFSRRARTADVALLFYAGHGMQVGGVNYLVPVDAQLADEADLPLETVSLDLVLERMGDGTNLVFLDACRDNPFARGWAGAGRTTAASRGLTRVGGASGSGLFIAFATDPDRIAADGEGRNSPFTAALKRHIETPGLEINHLLTEVRKAVLASTGDVQRPWSNSSLSDAFYFVPPSPASAKPDVSSRTGAPDPSTEMWLQIRETNNAQLLERYLATYPNSRYRPSAEARLDELRGQPFTVVVEPSGARVRILNIEPPYRPQMLLPQGSYQVEASAEGYETTTKSVAHGASPTVQRIVLRKAGPKVADRFRDCPGCPEMAVLPAGSYRMGSPSYEQGRLEVEGPVHEVTIAASFALGVYEVTVAEFGRFVDETGYSAGSSCVIYEGGNWKGRAGRGWRNPGFGQSARHPVVCVNWNDAQAYAAWLSRETGEQYRLPSESEWEYAARGSTATARYWGEGESGQCRHANGGDASTKARYSDWPGPVASCRDGHVHTAPVGSLTANGWGLHDMLGNVWEWTGDCWNGSYGGAPSDGSVWEYGECDERVLRGGSWDNVPSILRAAFRLRDSTGGRNGLVGFRVARTLTP